ncbi:hypothetical protein ALQ42_04935 [Pseudomonas savastanoi pv. glycinea]|uniref:Uncharacterized protein n=1 Tax=Pseudomonas savastanoi pv. glycinea TaxID=318 RepID=A0A3M3U6J6_PSESG|nr:hypothetical protein ALQ42_04935 [Pseudomonas savastanoi pv. glycinea]
MVLVSMSRFELLNFFRRYICVTTCNRNGLDLQSSRFSTGIDCVYPAPRTSIDCKRTCIQPLRPAIERNRPGLNATEKPMI